jgi:hypothetical protein
MREAWISTGFPRGSWAESLGPPRGDPHGAGLLTAIGQCHCPVATMRPFWVLFTRNTLIPKVFSAFSGEQARIEDTSAPQSPADDIPGDQRGVAPGSTGQNSCAAVLDSETLGFESFNFQS